MSIKEKLYTLIKDNNNETLLKEIYQILIESETDIILTDEQLKRIDLAEEEVKYGKVVSNDDLMKKLGNDQ